MKTIGILSDTHSCFDDRYARHFSECDEIWHAGDIGDVEVLERLRGICPVVRAVSGNIDHGIVSRECPELLIFSVDNLNVLITHIGGYPGKYSPGMKRLLVENNIDIFISGHSHILKIIPDRELGLLHINPGAAGYHGWQKVRTLVKLYIDKGTIKGVDVIELGKKPVDDKRC